MAMVTEDAARPGYVDVANLLKSCKNEHIASLWPVADLDYITSSKPDQLYVMVRLGASFSFLPNRTYFFNLYLYF